MCNSSLHKSFYEEYYKDKPQLSNKTILSKVKGRWKSNLAGILEEGDFNWRLAKYDAAIKFVDEDLKQFHKDLTKMRFLDNTYWIITADHGENLGEHDIYFDHHGLYDTTIHVPFIMWGNDVPRGKKVEGLLSQIDIFPTLFDLLGLKAKWMKLFGRLKQFRCDGRNLFDTIYANENFSRRFVEFEESYTQTKFGIRTEKFKLTESDIKSRVPMQPSLLGTPNIGELPYKCRYCGVVHGGINELYNLVKDSKEQNNLLGGIK